MCVCAGIDIKGSPITWVGVWPQQSRNLSLLVEVAPLARRYKIPDTNPKKYSWFAWWASVFQTVNTWCECLFMYVCLPVCFVRSCACPLTGPYRVLPQPCERTGHWAWLPDSVQLVGWSHWACCPSHVFYLQCLRTTLISLCPCQYCHYVLTRLNSYCVLAFPPMGPRVLLKRTRTKQRAQGTVSEGSLNIFSTI